MADVRLDFKSLADAGSMLGSGAVVVCAESTLHAGHGAELHAIFPQRILRQMRAVPRGLAENGGYAHRLDAGARLGSRDLALIDELSEAMRLTSICGLGQVVPAPIASVLKHFREEVEAHISRRECPAGVCFSVHDAERPRKRRAATRRA